MGFLETFLRWVAKQQKRFAIYILIFVVIITILLGVGIKDVRLQTDLQKEMPQQLPIFQLNDRVTDAFGGQDVVIILVQLDDSFGIKTSIDDIRDPYIIQSLIALEDVLSKETAVDSITSVAGYFEGEYFFTIEQVKAILDSNPGSTMFFSRDYKSTLMYIKADVGSSEEKIMRLSKLVQNNIDSVPSIPGVKISITGDPPMRTTILHLLSHDATFTLVVAALVILLLLFVMERSITKGLLVFIPLFIGLVWTMGVMGWMDIPLSIGTVGLGAMILGLGVEYGVFMLTRYYEEREKGNNQADSLLIAVPGVGSAILGSGLTTVVGFMALTLSITPMLQRLGASLALGIVCCLIAAVFTAPVFIILAEDIEYWYTHSRHAKLSVKKKRHGRMVR